jgi:folate-binding protein YgfZ
MHAPENATTDEALQRWRALEVRGEDARLWLHRVLSNDVKRLRPGDGAWNLVLDDRGRIQALGLLLCEEEQRFTLWSDEGQRDAWRAKLEFFLFAERVELRDDDAHGALELAGETIEAALERILGAELPTRTAAHVEGRIDGAPVRVVRDGRGPTPRFLVVAPRTALAPLARALELAGLGPLTAARLALLRLRDGIPSFGADLADGVRPAEAGLGYAFDLDKGCYPGQETVARMDTYGGPPRRLFGLELALEAPAPPPGTALLRAGENVGRSGSCVRDEEAACQRALVLVAKKAWNPGLQLELANGARGTLQELPFAAPRR